MKVKEQFCIFLFLYNYNNSSQNYSDMPSE
jgi:hypothetical protein